MIAVLAAFLLALAEQPVDHGPGVRPPPREPCLTISPRQVAVEFVPLDTAPPMRQRDLTAYYPERALRLEQGGWGVVVCTLRNRVPAACETAYEDPVGFGFGQAAAQLAGSMVAASATNGPQARYVATFRFIASEETSKRASKLGRLRRLGRLRLHLLLDPAGAERQLIV
jgi:hypothetical protein